MTFLFLSVLLTFPPTAADQVEADLVLRGATLYDGSGQPGLLVPGETESRLPRRQVKSSN